MEELWQFPCSWAAVDGCHIPIKCPPGGQSSRKEYHNFKNFYSIVLMALVSDLAISDLKSDSAKCQSKTIELELGDQSALLILDVHCFFKHSDLGKG